LELEFILQEHKRKKEKKKKNKNKDRDKEKSKKDKVFSKPLSFISSPCHWVILFIYTKFVVHTNIK
jgi:hypothetical protein